MTPFEAVVSPGSPMPVRGRQGPTAAMGSSPGPVATSPPAAGSPSLIDRILERKRAALVDLNGAADGPSRRRLRLTDPEESPEDKVSVQRFTLVSRGAPPVKRAAAEHETLRVPPRVAVHLGDEVQVCRCSQCDRSGIRRRISGTRLCRRDTESHPEYALLLSMVDRFEAECSERSRGGALVSEACCREKTAYFVLGPGSTTVGYVAAEIAANRRVLRINESVGSDASEARPAGSEDTVPTILQIYIEPDFRRKGYGSEALMKLLRGHDLVRVEEPGPALVSMLLSIGFAATGRDQEGKDGSMLSSFMRTASA